MVVMMSTYAALLCLIVRESRKTKVSLLTLEQKFSELVRKETKKDERSVTSQSPIRSRPASYLEIIPDTRGGEANTASSSETAEKQDLPVFSTGGSQTATRSRSSTKSGPTEDDSGYVIVDEVVTTTNTAYKTSGRKPVSLTTTHL